MDGRRAARLDDVPHAGCGDDCGIRHLDLAAADGDVAVCDRSGMPDARLTAALAGALLVEMVAHPGPQPDLREQLFLTLRQLDAMHAAGDEDYATSLRAEMVRRGVEPKAP